jgi:acetyl-CoA acetyltransferase
VQARAGLPHHHRGQRAPLDKGANALSNKTAGRDSSFFWQWYTPYHVHSAVNLMAMYAQAHFHRYGTTSEQLAQIALTCRANAQLNPKAVYRTPMTMADYMASRMISTPLRMFDCDVHCDASTAHRAVAGGRRAWRAEPAHSHRGHRLGAAPALVVGPDRPHPHGRLRRRRR